MYFATGDLCRQAGQRDAHTMDLQPFFCERPDNLSVEELHGGALRSVNLGRLKWTDSISGTRAASIRMSCRFV